jgi:hypothetical protein
LSWVWRAMVSNPSLPKNAVPGDGRAYLSGTSLDPN